MKLKFLWIGGTKDPNLQQMEKKYLKRIGRHFAVERAAVAELRKSDPRQVRAQLEKEADLLEKRLDRRAFLVVLDEAGQAMSSLELADFLDERIGRGQAELTFLAGGFWGTPERLIKRADKVLSLSRMTLPHEMARVVLLEQVYRAATIRQGLPYHK